MVVLFAEGTRFGDHANTHAQSNTHLISREKSVSENEPLLEPGMQHCIFSFFHLGTRLGFSVSLHTSPLHARHTTWLLEIPNDLASTCAFLSLQVCGVDNFTLVHLQREKYGLSLSFPPGLLSLCRVWAISVDLYPVV